MACTFSDQITLYFRKGGKKRGYHRTQVSPGGLACLCHSLAVCPSSSSFPSLGQFPCWSSEDLSVDLLVSQISQSKEASPFELLRGETEPFSISSLPRLSPGSGEQVGSEWKVLDTL